MRGHPYKHPTRPTSGIIIIRIVNNKSKYNELIDYCISNRIIYRIARNTVWIHLRKFNDRDLNWWWLVDYKYSLNDYQD